MNNINPITKNKESILKVLKSLNCIDNQNNINKSAFDAIGLKLIKKNDIFSFTQKNKNNEPEYLNTKLPDNAIVKLNYKHVKNLYSNYKT
jgi:hypothetical protein